MRSDDDADALLPAYAADELDNIVYRPAQREDENVPGAPLDESPMVSMAQRIVRIRGRIQRTMSIRL